MAMKSRRKGKVGELELAHFLSEQFGIDARRGQQFSGSKDSPDVITALSGVHFEVKRVEKLNLESAMEQSIRDSGAEEVPVVVHRRNRKPWMLTVRLADLPALTKNFIKHINKEESNGQ